MSKSIYEEASRRIDDMFDSWDKGIHQDSIEIIEEALEQAQKQEKLLKLYQRLYKDLDDLTLDEQLEIEKQIKELENDK